MVLLNLPGSVLKKEKVCACIGWEKMGINSFHKSKLIVFGHEHLLNQEEPSSTSHGVSAFRN